MLLLQHEKYHKEQLWYSAVFFAFYSWTELRQEGFFAFYSWTELRQEGFQKKLFLLTFSMQVLAFAPSNFLLELFAKLMANFLPNLSRKIGKNRQKYSVFPEENISFLLYTWVLIREKRLSHSCSCWDEYIQRKFFTFEYTPPII